MYRISISERHICILLWTLIGTDEFFIGVGNVGDTIGDDEVFVVVVVAIDAGFFVLVVEGFDVNSVFVVVNYDEVTANCFELLLLLS